MAKITVTEHRAIMVDVMGARVAVLGKPLATQSGLAAPSAGSAQTAVAGVDTKILRICSDVALHIGYNEAATAIDDYWPAGAEIVYKVDAGQRLSYIAG